jgi:nitroreductase
MNRMRGANIYHAVQNIILDCRAVGSGTALITHRLRCQDEAKSPLCLPPNVETFALVPIGYALGKCGPSAQCPPNEVVRADRWSMPPPVPRSGAGQERPR